MKDGRYVVPFAFQLAESPTYKILQWGVTVNALARYVSNSFITLASLPDLEPSIPVDFRFEGTVVVRNRRWARKKRK